MLSENLQTLRKEKGLSQEALAARLHVVRQTVSKWEKGLSVPDAEMLLKLADILETDVATLLGAPIETKEDPSALAMQLGRIAEEMAVKNRRTRRIWHTIGLIFLVLLLLNLFQFIGAFLLSATTSVEMQTTTMIP